MEKNAPNQFSTLLECVNALEAQGYVDPLTMSATAFNSGSRSLDPADFRVDSYHRFEGPTDPADMSVVYAVSSASLGIKGLLIGSYGSDPSVMLQKMLRDVNVTHFPWLQGSTRPVQAIRAGASTKIS